MPACHSPASSRNSHVSGLRSGCTRAETLVITAGVCAAPVKVRFPAEIVAVRGAGSIVIMKVPVASSWFGADALNWTMCVQMFEKDVSNVAAHSLVPTRYW